MLTLTDYKDKLQDEEERNRFRQIYEQYSGLMLYRAEQILKDKQLAEDAVSQAFINILLNLSKISGIECNKLRHYVVIVVERTAIDIYRKEKRRKNIICDKDPELLTAELTDTLEAQFNPVEKCIYQLPEIYKEIFVLKYCYGYSNHMISEILKVKETTIRQRIMRGKEVLKKMLKEEGIDV